MHLFGVNPHLPHFLNLPCAGFWSSRGVKKIGDLFLEGHYKSFAALYGEESTPTAKVFLYFQLRHAAASQFHGLTIQWPDLPLEEMLTSFSSFKLISFYYLTLMTVHANNYLSAGRKWDSEIHELAQDGWLEVADLGCLQ